MPDNKPSFFSLLFVFVVYIFSFFYYEMWHLGAKGGDPLGYYTYLPALFLHKDITDLEKTNLARAQQFGESINPTYYEENGIVYLHSNGNRVLKYTCGLAITVAPFFGIAHLLAPIFGYTTNGFSPIYLFTFYFAGFFYVLLGLYLLRKILLVYFEDQIVAWVLLLIALGTNLYFFAVYHSVMTHATLFFLHTLVIYKTIQLYERPTWLNSVLLGIALGLIILIRPVEIIIVLIPLLWGLPSLKKETFYRRVRFLKKNWRLLMGITLTTALFGLPQFIYWYAITGSPFYYSYGEEGFDFLNPQIIKGLFSYTNGWLAYTPMMYFSLIGIYFLYKKRAFFYPVLCFLVLHIYITYSWWCWNYINGFGSRPMVEVYGLLSVPMAYFWQHIQKKKLLRGGSLLLALFFIFLNLSNTWQFSKGLLWSESAKGAYYFSMIGKTYLDYEDLVVYDCGEWQPDTTQFINYKTLYFNDFESSTPNLQFSTAFKKSKKQSCYLTSMPEKVVLFQKKIADLPLKKGVYLKASLSAMKLTGTPSIYDSSILAIRFQSKDGKGVKTRRIRINNKINNPANSFWGLGRALFGTKCIFSLKFQAYLWMQN